jgi:hypothetical protein
VSLPTPQGPSTTAPVSTPTPPVSMPTPVAEPIPGPTPMAGVSQPGQDVTAVDPQSGVLGYNFLTGDQCFNVYTDNQCLNAYTNSDATNAFTLNQGLNPFCTFDSVDPYLAQQGTSTAASWPGVPQVLSSQAIEDTGIASYPPDEAQPTARPELGVSQAQPDGSAIPIEKLPTTDANVASPTQQEESQPSVLDEIRSTISTTTEAIGTAVGEAVDYVSSLTVATGVSVQWSSILPTSGGGGVVGLNLEAFGNLSDPGFGLYEYHTPADTPSYGFSFGPSAQVNLAVGTGGIGAWSGPFDSAEGNIPAEGLLGPSGSLFMSSGPGGYVGLAGGVAIGPPGFGITTTTYTPVFEFRLSDFAAWMERGIYQLYGVPAP